MLRLPSGSLEFPHVIDSTMRSDWASCECKFMYAHLKHLRKSTSNIHLHFGGCLARALEVTRKEFFQNGRSEKDALSKGLYELIKVWGLDWDDPPSDKKTLASCCDALVSYFERYPLSQDPIQPLMIQGKPAVEMSFAVPIPGCFHPVDNEPLIYAGRFDMVGMFNNAVFAIDEKTSGALGSYWRNNWRLRAQLSGYCWGLRSYGIAAQGAIIRGIGIMARDITFEQVIETRTQWDIDRWLEQLQRDVQQAIKAWKNGEYNQSLGDACTSFGGCTYIELCESQHPERWESNFIVSKWDPLHRSVDD